MNNSYNLGARFSLLLSDKSLQMRNINYMYDLKLGQSIYSATSIHLVKLQSIYRCTVSFKPCTVKLQSVYRETSIHLQGNFNPFTVKLQAMNSETSSHVQ